MRKVHKVQTAGYLAGEITGFPKVDGACVVHFGHFGVKTILVRSSTLHTKT
jgi:hypothetical protein